MKSLQFAFICISFFDKRGRLKKKKPETFFLRCKKSGRSLNAFIKLENRFQIWIHFYKKSKDLENRCKIKVEEEM